MSVISEQRGDSDGFIPLKKADKAYQEMREARWMDAINTISILSKKHVNKQMYETLPSAGEAPSWTLLSYAISKRKIDIAKVLVTKGADVNKHSERMHQDRIVKFTPFELAVEMNCIEACQLLTENDANIYLQSSNPIGNILENAILHENIDLVKLILDHRLYSDDTISSCIGSVVAKIRHATVRSAMTECLQIFLLSGQTTLTTPVKAMLMIQNSTEDEALHFIKGQHLDVLKHRVAKHDRRVTYKNNMLIFATKLNKVKVVKALLEKGFGVNQPKFPPGYTLLIAVQENMFEMCKLLLEWGAEVEIDNIYTSSMIRYTLKNENPHILKLLVDRLNDPWVRVLKSLTVENAECPSKCTYIMNTFSLELLSEILLKSPVSMDTWLDLIRCRLAHGYVTMNKRYLLEMLVNYLPLPTEELQAALQILEQSSSESETSQTKEVVSWIRNATAKCPSLQDLCRYSIRQAVQPCTADNIQSLNMPDLIREFLLEHPLQKLCET